MPISLKIFLTCGILFVVTMACFALTDNGTKIEKGEAIFGCISAILLSLMILSGITFIWSM